MSNRIKAVHQISNGDSGYSSLLNGHKLPKDHSAANIYAESEWLNYSINKFLLKYELQYEYLNYILNWLKKNSFSIGAFAYNLGDTERHALSVEFMDKLDDEVNKLNSDKNIGEAADFVIHNKEQYVALDGIRIIVRDTERAYTTWNKDEIVNDYLLRTTAFEPHKGQKISIDRLTYAKFFNRLSKFIWLATRKEAELCGDYDTQQYWNGGISN